MSKRSNLKKNFTRSINSILCTSGDLPETLRKLYLSTKCPYQKIRWNYGISCSEIDWKNRYIAALGYEISEKDNSIHSQVLLK